jgi:hypothetical protein
MIFPSPSPVEYVKAFSLALCAGLALGIALAERWSDR